jgi:SNF2 family DNA or RNA helicase
MIIHHRPVEDVPGLMKAVQESMAFGFDVNIYPDASEYIDSVLYKERMAGLVSQILADPGTHPLKTSLLKKPLLNYQLEGIAFAAGRGRAVLADDMGLGKTIQGIGVAELLQNQAGIKKVLIISPASLKIQWSREIERFSESSCTIIQGTAEERGQQYPDQQFYTICNYEQVLRDFTFISRVKWDLIILDEGQRIKNYESKTSKLIKSLRSTYALVLSGTPLENRLEELFSIINFIDNMVLGPAFQFFEDYHVKDAKGKVTGYKNLDKLREKLKPVLLRRTRSQVLPELPPLSEETRFIPATDEQLAIDVANRRTMQSVISKRRISEMDLLKLRKAMTASRMSANCPALADRQSDSESGKLVELTDLLDQLSDSKILIFSEWNGMLDIISARLDELSITYNRVDGKMKAAQKEISVEGFNNDKSVNVLLCSNTAAHGLNLQSADTVINVDIPWNPATHEQRSARAHRMGQTKPVQVINLITAGTIEERIFNNFDRKLELFTAALDPKTDICEISMTEGMSDLRSRLQTLLSSSSRKHNDTVIALRGANPDNIALSGGNLLGSALHFLADLLQTGEADEAADGLTRELRRLLMHSFKRNESGELEITLRFADDEAIDRLASALARLSSLGINRAGN